MVIVDIDREVCKGCGLCIDACKQNILGRDNKLNSKGFYPSKVVLSGKCVGCGNCAIICPDSAVRVIKE